MYRLRKNNDYSITLNLRLIRDTWVFYKKKLRSHASLTKSTTMNRNKYTEKVTLYCPLCVLISYDHINMDGTSRMFVR